MENLKTIYKVNIKNGVVSPKRLPINDNSWKIDPYSFEDKDAAEDFAAPIKEANNQVHEDEVDPNEALVEAAERYKEEQEIVNNQHSEKLCESMNNDSEEDEDLQIDFDKVNDEIASDIFEDEIRTDELDKFMKCIKPGRSIYSFRYDESDESGEFWKECIEKVSRVETKDKVYYTVETDKNDFDIDSVNHFKEQNYFKTKKELINMFKI